MNYSSFIIKNFEVDKNLWGKTQLSEQQSSTDLAEDEVLLKVEKFALTANNITYCLAGDLLDYWGFYPAQDNWGRIPAMGFAEVIGSAHSDIKIGERVWGFLPMSTHLKIKAGKVNQHHFKDVAKHRKDHATVYTNFERLSLNPGYNPEHDDLMMLLKGLFMTSWLVEDFMFDNDHFGVNQFLITSASSKTSISLAYAVKQRGMSQSIGLTSSANLAFVKDLGCYDQVLTYQDVKTLDAEQASVVVDMAGNTKLLAEVHHHFKDNIRYSCQVGMTHHSNAGGQPDTLPGAKPTFFFAPSQIEKRTNDWGPGVVETRVGEMLANFITFFGKQIKVVHHKGSGSINGIYQEVLAGEANPKEGHILSLWA